MVEKNFTAEELEQIAELRELFVGGAAKELREVAGVSRFKVATLVPCDPSAVMRWESASRVPRPEVALRLAVIYRDLAARAAELVEQRVK